MNIQDFLKNFHDITKAKEKQKATIDILLLTINFFFETFDEKVEKY